MGAEGLGFGTLDFATVGFVKRYCSTFGACLTRASRALQALNAKAA